MAIVRNDKRQNAIESITEIRAGISDTLLRIDAIQASLEDLELSLGLASEGQQDGRERYAVTHFLKGENDGHSVDGCSLVCRDNAADEVIEDLETAKNEGGDEDRQSE